MSGLDTYYLFGTNVSWFVVFMALKWVKSGSKGDLSSVPKPDPLDEFY